MTAVEIVQKLPRELSFVRGGPPECVVFARCDGEKSLSTSLLNLVPEHLLKECTSSAEAALLMVMRSFGHSIEAIERLTAERIGAFREAAAAFAGDFLAELVEPGKKVVHYRFELNEWLRSGPVSSTFRSLAFERPS